MAKSIETGSVKIIPLGGLEQIGMNMTAFMYGDSIIVVDCGCRAGSNEESTERSCGRSGPG